MAAPEAVPFGDRDAARGFADTHGGTVLAYDDIPDAELLGPVDSHAPDQMATDHGGHAMRRHGHDDAD